MLAWRNLVHDKVRLAVTVTGIVFAVVLIVVEFGLFLGFTSSIASLIERSGADFWVTARNVPYIEQGVPFTDRKLATALSTPGVGAASTYITRFSQWKRPDGQQESVQVVGVDLQTGLGAPWNLVEGTLDDLRRPDAVFIDEIYREKLGVDRVGQTVEIRGRRARVAGFTRGIRAFTTAPYVFTTFRNALDYGGLQADQTMFLLVRAAPGADLAAVQRALGARLPDVDVLPTGAFARRTQMYWMFTTGAGIAVLLAALLGLIVGVVVVAQTIYATTVDHIREYGTLKAMGASNRYLYGVIIQQAVIAAGIGYTLGMVVSAFVVRGSQQGGAAILLPGWMVAGMLALTMVMCIGAALVSIKRVTSLDPAMVFKG
ncbi:MAG TPA: ABC transporter permease [Vicinamibacterales bacterium]|nr:ABC transporter permease [Vicinamibacterales bacterium]